MNTRPIKWKATLIDTGDGSGDAFVELPDDLLASLGWEVGDTLTLKILDDQIRLTNDSNDHETSCSIRSSLRI
jgi:hypothetical protein